MEIKKIHNNVFVVEYEDGTLHLAFKKEGETILLGTKDPE